MRHVLLIRPLIDALPVAQSLKAKGIVSHLYPLFKPCALSFPPLETPQALIITSKNALRAIEGYEDLKKFPLYVVGDQTAQLAQALGFSTVISASGTSQDLTQLILRQAHPKSGILWHLSGEMIKEDIVQKLQAAGLRAKRQIVYRIEGVEDLPPALLSDLQTQKISHVLFFSSQTTFFFVNLLKTHQLEKAACHLTALCLSQDVAEKARPLKWKKIWISPRPTLQSMIGYFDEKA